MDHLIFEVFGDEEKLTFDKNRQQIGMLQFSPLTAQQHTINQSATLSQNETFNEAFYHAKWRYLSWGQRHQKDIDCYSYAINGIETKITPKRGLKLHDILSIQAHC